MNEKKIIKNMIDDAMGLLMNHTHHEDLQWKLDYEYLCKRYELLYDDKIS